MQYDEWRQKMNDCYSVGSPIVTDMPRGREKTSIVERNAMDAQRYADKIEKIEKAAREASEGSEIMYKCLMKCVTCGIRYEHMNVPCGRAKFYTMRRLFFWLLDKKV
mgnify:CR=1 FL=1